MTQFTNTTQFTTFQKFFEQKETADLRDLIFILSYITFQILESYNDNSDAAQHEILTIDTLKEVQEVLIKRYEGEEGKKLAVTHKKNRILLSDIFLPDLLEEYTNIIKWIKTDIIYEREYDAIQTINLFIKQSNEEPILIKDIYFEEWAEIFAKDVYFFDDNNPLRNHIDWKSWAKELKNDYTEVTNLYQDDNYNVWLYQNY